MADEELKKAFQDLQFKNMEMKTRIAEGESSKKIHLQKARMSELTCKSLTEIKNDLAVYRSVGRMFIMTTKEREIERHRREASSFRDKADSYDREREYLKRSMDESERNLREMIQARRS